MSEFQISTRDGSTANVVLCTDEYSNFGLFEQPSDKCVVTGHAHLVDGKIAIVVNDTDARFDPLIAEIELQAMLTASVTTIN